MSRAGASARVISVVPGIEPADLVPEIMLPSQFDDLRRRVPAPTPEHRLMLAVLEDAVHTYQVGCDAQGVRGRTLFLETEAWFVSDDTPSPFSFVTICQAFGLDPDYLRAGLRRWRTRREADGRRSSRAIPIRIRRVSGSRHQVTVRRRASGGSRDQ